MNINPKDKISDLQTLIVFTYKAPTYIKEFPIIPGVEQYIFIHGDLYKPPQYVAVQFNKVIEYDYTQPLDELIKLVKQFIINPEKTRLIGISDCTALEVAKLREHFNIKGRTFQQQIIFDDKKKCKEILKNSKVNLHDYYIPDLNQLKQNFQKELEIIEKKIDYPMYLKPTNDFASLQNFKVMNQDELKNALQIYIQKNQNFEIDEFLTGTLLEIDCIIIKNEIKFFVCWENLSDFIKVNDGITQGQVMLRPSDPRYQRLFKLLENIIEAYGQFPDDVLDVEVWHTPKDKFVFQELQLRRPGNTVIQAIQRCTGVNFEKIQMQLGCGQMIRLPYDDFKTPWKVYGSWLEYQSKTGKTIQQLS